MRTELLSSAKAELLWLMKRNEKISIKDAEGALELSASTVRQHLSDLERDGFIGHRSERHGVGRPRKVYSLRAKADRFFERRDREVLQQLIRFLQSEQDKGQVERFFRSMGPELMRFRHQDLSDTSPSKQVEVLNDYLTERGYAPDVSLDDEGRIVMELFHCPFATVATESSAPCAMELALLEKVLGQGVEKTQHMFDDGAHCCRLVVRAKCPAKDEGACAEGPGFIE